MKASTREDPLIGAVVGKCTLRRQLGAGGMGSVYLGHHGGLNKPVAVKLMSGALAKNSDFVARFLREARLAAKLEHPNVVQVFDVGEEQGTYYISMQYVEGRTLDAVLRERKRLSVQESLSIAKRVALALGAAHKLGIVHRDIKPANILISKEGVVKVVDFGLAKDQDSARSSISGTGEIMGTPYYMSPEQAQGEKVDTRSDLYSLGATLYHMLTGRRAFEGDNPISVVLKQINTELVPPDRVEGSVPAPVSAFVARLMAKDPAARPSSAEELVRELEALKPAAPAPREPLSRRRAAMIALPIAGILGIGIILGVILAGGKEEPAAQPVPTPVPPAKTAPAPKPPEPAPVASKKPPPSEKVLARFADAQERRAAEEVLSRTEGFLKAVKDKDARAMRPFLDRLTYGDASEAAAREMLARALQDSNAELKSWEVQDLALRRGALARVSNAATVTAAYTLETGRASITVHEPVLHWVRRLDGQWYLTRPPRTDR